MKTFELELPFSNADAGTAASRPGALESAIKIGARPFPPSGNGYTINRSQHTESLEKRSNAGLGRNLEQSMTLVLLVLALASGLLAAVRTVLASRTTTLHLGFEYLPQVLGSMLGLAGLITMCAGRKQMARSAESAALEELPPSEQLPQFSLLDPVTQLLKPFSIESVASREAARATRLGSSLSFAAIAVTYNASCPKQAGVEADDEALYYAGRLVKNTFRRSDAVFRTGAREFLVIMSDTSEPEAANAISRLTANTEGWNSESGTGVELNFSAGLAAYVPGAQCADIIERARRSMFLNSQNVHFADEVPPC